MPLTVSVTGFEVNPARKITSTSTLAEAPFRTTVPPEEFNTSEYWNPSVTVSAYVKLFAFVADLPTRLIV